MDSEHELRTQAVHRLKSRHAFWRTAFTFLVVAGLLVVVWLLSGMGYFWPAWAMLGMGIALAFAAVGTFGPHSVGPSESQINAEMDKLRQQQS